MHTVPGAGQRFHTEVPPEEGHLQGAQVLDVPWSNAAMQARKAAIGFIPPPGLGFCTSLPAIAEDGLLRASPNLPGTALPQVFSVHDHNMRVPSSQFPISTRAWKNRRKLTF